LAESFGLDKPSGALVARVMDGGPAAKAGLRDGDIITKIEGTPVDAAHPIDDTLVQYAPGRGVLVEIYREGQYMTFRVTLGARPESS
jgi:serine protease Do